MHYFCKEKRRFWTASIFRKQTKSVVAVLSLLCSVNYIPIAKSWHAATTCSFTGEILMIIALHQLNIKYYRAIAYCRNSSISIHEPSRRRSISISRCGWEAYVADVLCSHRQWQQVQLWCCSETTHESRCNTFSEGDTSEAKTGLSSFANECVLCTILMTPYSCCFQIVGSS